MREGAPPHNVPSKNGVMEDIGDTVTNITVPSCLPSVITIRYRRAWILKEITAVVAFSGTIVPSHNFNDMFKSQNITWEKVNSPRRIDGGVSQESLLSPVIIVLDTRPLGNQDGTVDVVLLR